MTANDLIKQALRELGVIRQNQEPTASQNVRAFTKLNQFMADMFGSSVDIGYYTVENGSDTLPLDEADEYAIRMNFAVVLATGFAAPVSELVLREARRTKRRLERDTEEVGEADMCGVPGGSSSRYNIETG